MRKYLVNYRKQFNLTHEEAAKRACISRSHYSNIENGARQADMNFSVIQKLAKAFNVSEQEIIDLEKQYLTNKEPKESA